MTGGSNAPVEIQASRRRASTVESTGLDYPSSHWVDEDIKSRIRSLLLSRNERCPPRTPFSSDEHNHRLSESCTTVSGFDVNSAKSLASPTKEHNRHLSLAGIRRALSRSAHSDMGGSRRSTRPSLPGVSFASHLLRSSSADDLKASIDRPSSPAPKKKFKLPKLVLQDKRKPGIEVKSCIEISPLIPENDAKIHEDELDCCPPCDPRDSQPSKYIVNHPTQPGGAIKYDPADLACFLAGCPPGQSNCLKHPRRESRRSTIFSCQSGRQSRASGHGRNLAEDLSCVSEGLIKDGTKICQAALDSMRTTDGNASTARSPISRDPLLSPVPEKVLPPSGLKTPPLLSESSSVTSGSFDAFPHATQSLEKAIMDKSNEHLITAINTNFSLSGVRAKHRVAFPRDFQKPSIGPENQQAEDEQNGPQPVGFTGVGEESGPRPVHFNRFFRVSIEDERLTTEASNPVKLPGETGEKHGGFGISLSASPATYDPIRTKQSDDSLKTKAQSPSLLSTSSRKSARHALLKPIVSQDERVDTGLPIPPLLSTASGVAEKSQIITSPEASLDAVVRAAAEGLMEKQENPPSVDSAVKVAAEGLKTKAGNKEKEYFDESGSTVSEAGPNSPFNRANSNVFDAWRDVADALPSSVVGHLTNLQKAMDLVDRVRDRILDAQEEVKAIAIPKPPSAAATSPPFAKSPPNEFRSGFVSPKIHRLADCQSPPRVEAPSPARPAVQDPGNISAPDKLSPKFSGPGSSDTSADSLNAAYWGFVPQVKEVVHDAVHKAVRKAVHEVVMPPGIDPDEASDAYRKLVADNLTKAAKKADDSLRRASLWNEPPQSRRESEATVLVRGKPSNSDSDWGKKDPSQLSKDASPVQPYSSVYQGSICDKDRENTRSPSPESPKQGIDYGNISCIPAAFDTEQSQALNSMTRPFAEMEEVPLEDKEKPGDKGSRRKTRKKGLLGYSAIPTRDSSMKNVLSAKSTAKNSSTKGSVTGKVSRKRSYETLSGREVRVLRSISSAGSLRVSVEKNRDDLPLLPSQGLGKALSHKNTVHWLKDVLSTNGPSGTRFTDLPPRTRLGQDPFNTIRSNTAPIKPVTDLFLSATPKPILEPPPKAAKPPSSRVARLKRADASETFTKTIKDLESLMNEALSIARQAADEQDPLYIPAVLGNATKVLKSGRKGESESRLLPNRRSEMSSFPSVHESVRSYTDSDGTYESDEAEITMHTIPISATNRERNDSGWPPTGRASTPHPPASQPPSGEALNKIKSADPRSKVTENNIEAPRRKGTGVPPGFGPNFAVEAEAADSRPVEEEGRQTGFVNLEPFQRTMTDKRKSSDKKSPKCMTPKKQSTVKAVMQDESYEILPGPIGAPVDFCGQPVGHPLPRPDRGPSTWLNCNQGHPEDDHRAVSARLASKPVSNRREVRSHITEHHAPPIQSRDSSLNLRKKDKERGILKAVSQKSGYTVKSGQTGKIYIWQDVDYTKIEPRSQVETQNAPASRLMQIQIDHSRGGTHSLDGSVTTRSEEMDFDHAYSHGVRHRGGAGEPSGSRGAIELQDNPDPTLPVITKGGKESSKKHFNLSGKRHVSLRSHHLKGFSLARSHKRQAIARDWSPGRKRFVATVACLSTALIGILVGVYAGETPAIQYYIVDFHHYTVLGNVFFFIGLAVPTFFFWPLPLLHGRKPYILGAMSLAMPLLFPQALAVGSFRSPYVSTYRVGLLMSRALMGFCLGFANINFKGMLTDLFGASLQSTHPHQEHVDDFDVRRHGGGMGMWLGLWTWSALGSIGLGFLIGACIINTLPPAYGFYVSIIIIAFIMLLNVLCPEVRRSAFRRSVAEVVTENAVSRRLARGEVKMHMVQSGPKWWGEELHYGVMLSRKMIRQPGFMIMALYVAWIYGQQVFIIVLLGALMSKDYKFLSPMVGLSVMAIPLGALVAIPFQKAGLFSRSRTHSPVSDDSTFKKRLQVSSHIVRRTIFVLCLPVAGICYTATSGGPPTPFILPILFAGLIGFLSNLAMAECHGIIMETFDTSDLQPGMTGRPRGSSGDNTATKRTNYSSFPRVMSAFAITQGFGYMFAAAASGVGGVLTRHLGQQAATGVMAGVLSILSILLLVVLIRFTEVQIIPDSKKDEMDRYHQARRASQMRRDGGEQEDEEPWRPVIIGNPHHSTRRMNLLELGSLSRFSEIRIKNRLVDERQHLNRAAIEVFEAKFKEKEQEVVNNIRRSLSRHSSRGSRRSDRYSERDGDQGDPSLGGHREIFRSGNGSGRRGRSQPSNRGERRTTETREH